MSKQRVRQALTFSGLRQHPLPLLRGLADQFKKTLSSWIPDDEQVSPSLKQLTIREYLRGDNHIKHYNQNLKGIFNIQDLITKWQRS